MGLVDYSESDSSDAENDTQPKVASKPSQTTQKRPFQKVVDRSNPGKIVVSLPSASGSNGAAAGDEPPAKRARSAGGGLFSGFNSFLPPPKNANKPTAKPAAAQSRPGIGLRTGAAPAFSRDGGDTDGHENDASGEGSSLPPPSKPAEPSIPEGLKPAEEVKLVGKPLMFKPLSVARNPAKKKKANAGKQAATGIGLISKASESPSGPQASAIPGRADAAAAPPAPKKVSLFSLHTEEPSEPSVANSSGETYQPLFASQEVTASYPDTEGQFAGYAQAGTSAARASNTESLDSVADDLNLSAAARRELFGRGGGGQAAKKIINFNLDTEYQHNEEVRAAGEQQIHNPVRSIQGGGKHSLRQLVQNANSQREALEESFAQGKSNRKEASSRYGW
ncbi:hypothetical protein HJFPF1_03517 [Paramyrothecium foliicola]|nr:hypothetical protein HJFPF1_03517 [Paramyrothecium foliicola]